MKKRINMNNICFCRWITYWYSCDAPKLCTDEVQYLGQKLRRQKIVRKNQQGLVHQNRTFTFASNVITQGHKLNNGKQWEHFLNRFPPPYHYTFSLSSFGCWQDVMRIRTTWYQTNKWVGRIWLLHNVFGEVLKCQDDSALPLLATMALRHKETRRL